MIQLPIRLRRGPAPARTTVAWFIPGGQPHLWVSELIRWSVSQTDLRLHVIPSTQADLQPRGVLVLCQSSIMGFDVKVHGGKNVADRSAISAFGSQSQPPRPNVADRSAISAFSSHSEPQRSGEAPPIPKVDKALVSSTGQDLEKASPRCQPYGTYCNRLYLPVDALVDPEVTSREMELLLPNEDSIYVWHPATGLVGFESSDVLRLSDLFAPPPEREIAWDAAQPGTHFADRLVSVDPTDVASLEEFLAEAGDDIGTEASAIEQLPPSPDEPETGLIDKLKRGILGGALNLVSRWTARSAPSDAADPSGGGGLGQWLQQRLETLDMDAVQTARETALQRLLRLLEETPDEGLRFAPPISDADDHRGQASPSWDLGEQDVDFSLNKLRGSGPADCWDVPFYIQRRLLELYRELANREIQLGRHRRAAFIFAKLLGEFHAAASVLRTGGHSREAAILYRDHLNAPLTAAQCFEEGGHWSDALALYEKLHEHQRIGDLHTRLEQHQLAEQAYRRAVSGHLDKSDLLAAAKVLEEKLDLPREALAVVAGGWPTSPQAGGCLEEMFRLYGRLGDHEAASKQIASLLDKRLPDGKKTALAEVLTHAAGTYPDVAVQASAKDAVRVVCGQSLPSATAETTAKFMTCLRKLAPADRLLTRDCDRFQDLRRWQSRRRRARPKRTVHLEPVREIRLSAHVRWHRAISTRDGFYAVGWKDGQLVLAQGLWDGAVREYELGQPQGVMGGDQPILLAVNLGSVHEVWLRVLDCQPLSPQSFPSTDRLPGIVVGTPPWLPETAVALGKSPTGLAWCIDLRDGQLIAMAQDGTSLLGARTLQFSDDWLASETDAPLPSLCTRGFAAYVGLASQVITLDGRVSETIELTRSIRSITAHEGSKSKPLAVSTEAGGIVIWPPLDDPQLEPFAEDLTSPVVGFTRSGWLIAADETAVDISRLDLSARHVIWHATEGPPAAAPIAILTAAHEDQFALLMANGRLQMFLLPGSSKGNP